LHKEDVGHVQLPGFVLAAELSRLAEDLFDHGVVSLVPVDLGLHHKNRDVLVEGQIIFLESIVDRLGVSCDPGILDGLGPLAERVDVLVGELFELSECLLL